jgi:hypothetical protein
MASLAHKYRTHADFIAVYVSEAHPTDQWQVYSDIDYCQPKTLDQRAAAASKYLEENIAEGKMQDGVEVPLVLDNMKDEAEFAYSAHPGSQVRGGVLVLVLC